jgi:hypothetical protein
MTNCITSQCMPWSRALRAVSTQFPGRWPKCSQSSQAERSYNGWKRERLSPSHTPFSGAMVRQSRATAQSESFGEAPGLPKPHPGERLCIRSGSSTRRRKRVAGCHPERSRSAAKDLSFPKQRSFVAAQDDNPKGISASLY